MTLFELHEILDKIIKFGNYAVFEPRRSNSSNTDLLKNYPLRIYMHRKGYKKRYNLLAELSYNYKPFGVNYLIVLCPHQILSELKKKYKASNPFHKTVIDIIRPNDPIDEDILNDLGLDGIFITTHNKIKEIRNGSK